MDILYSLQPTCVVPMDADDNTPGSCVDSFGAPCWPCYQRMHCAETLGSENEMMIFDIRSHRAVSGGITHMPCMTGSALHVVACADGQVGVLVSPPCGFDSLSRL
jgi:hypothetical protein